MNLFRNWWFLATRMTAPERALEPAIAALGERYRAQWLFLGLPVARKNKTCIADFVLLDRQLVIEVDGASHDDPKQKLKDLENAVALKKLGWDVYRVSNARTLADPEGTVEAALTAPRKALAELEGALEQHLRDFPPLLAESAKRTRSTKAGRPKSARTSSPAPRKRPTRRPDHS